MTVQKTTPDPDSENPNRPTAAELAQEIIAATKPVPGYEDSGMRYAGNELIGYFLCIKSGAVIVSDSGMPIVWPTMAHLRVCANNWLMQQSSIVIPAGGFPPPSDKRN